MRGHALCGTRPLVHVGFMKAWLAGAFNEKVINHVMQLVNRPRSEAHGMKIYVTGQMHPSALVVLSASMIQYMPCAEMDYRLMQVGLVLRH